METDLLELLSSRHIIHPTRILSIVDTAEAVRVSLSGCPWWQDDCSGPDAVYEFHFTQVSYGHLSVTGAWNSDWDEDMDDFIVEHLQDPSWASKSWEIFCSDPLKSPLDLYGRLEKYLADSDSFLRPRDFLNCSSSRPVSSFAEIAESRSYLLARCPEGVRDLLTQELHRQNVKYNVLTCEDIDRPALLRVRFKGSDFLCSTAKAILPDEAS